MSTEELVVAIQSGETQLMEQLWTQVLGFVIQQARRVPLEGRADVETEDLIQSGYLALVRAVADYRPEIGSFLTALGYRLKTAFAEATHFQSERQKRETLNTPLSLDAPLTDDPHGDTFVDILQDPAATAAIDAAEDQIYRKQLRSALEKAISTSLSPQQQQILRMRYFQAQTCEAVARSLSCTASNVGDQERTALAKLYSGRKLNGLDAFVEQCTNFHLHVGVQGFQRTGSSAVELLVMRREALREKLQKRYGGNTHADTKTTQGTL